MIITHVRAVQPEADRAPARLAWRYWADSGSD